MENDNSNEQELNLQKSTKKNGDTNDCMSNHSLLNQKEFKEEEIDSNGKKIKKNNKKTPKVKVPKPGQVLIATAVDGTTLFCCPECEMAYPEKENLEQHLTEHKIERR